MTYIVVKNNILILNIPTNRSYNHYKEDKSQKALLDWVLE